MKYLPFRVVMILLLLLFIGCSGDGNGTNGSESFDAYLESAGTLKQKGFYAQASQIYRQLVFDTAIPASRRGNVSFLLAEMTLEHLNDPESAYTYYLLAESWVEDQELLTKITRGKVASLERTGRSLAATEALERATDLVTAPKEGEGKAIARIGKREIFEAEVRKDLDQLPESLKGRFAGDEGFSLFLEQYLASKVVLDSAQRMGLDRDPEVQERLALLRDEVVKNAYLEREMEGKLSVNDSEAGRYYSDNLERFKDKDSGSTAPYDEVREFCMNAVRMQKQGQATSQLINRLFEAADVEIYGK